MLATLACAARTGLVVPVRRTMPISPPLLVGFRVTTASRNAPPVRRPCDRGRRSRSGGPVPRCAASLPIANPAGGITAPQHAQVCCFARCHGARVYLLRSVTGFEDLELDPSARRPRPQCDAGPQRPLTPCLLAKPERSHQRDLGPAVRGLATHGSRPGGTRSGWPRPVSLGYRSASSFSAAVLISAPTRRNSSASPGP